MSRIFRVVSDAEEPGIESSQVSSSLPILPELRPTPPHLCDRWSTIGLTVSLLLIAGILSFFADLPVSWQLNQARLLKAIHRTLEMAEPYGDFAGVILIAAGIWVLNPAGRSRIPLLILGTASCGLAADVVKLMVGRIRPTDLNWGEPLTLAGTFTGWFPLLHGGWRHQSFPSAHTATAWGLAMLLVRLYPRGRWFFPSVAACVAFQRVETGSHFLSDAIFGTAIGIGVSCVWLRSRLFEGFLPVEAVTGIELPDQVNLANDRRFGTESSAG